MQVLSTYRFTVDKYHRLGEVGILGEDDRVEVADSSLSYDVGPKLDAYARAGICEVWVIDIIRRRVLIHRQPDQGRYETRLELPMDGVLTIEAFPDTTLPVAKVMHT
jgi:Uma2 family endonuclease